MSSPGLPDVIASQTSFEFLAHKNKIVITETIDVFSIMCLSFHLVVVFLDGQHEIGIFHDLCINLCVNF